MKGAETTEKRPGLTPYRRAGAQNERPSCAPRADGGVRARKTDGRLARRAPMAACGRAKQTGRQRSGSQGLRGARFV